jgi:hypothetical protein
LKSQWPPNLSARLQKRIRSNAHSMSGFGAK